MIPHMEKLFGLGTYRYFTSHFLIKDSPEQGRQSLL